jgi:F0F1-type ATP synthase delta subunit
MLAIDYATALAKNIEEGRELKDVLASLDRVLVKKGHEKLRPRILSELAHRFEGRGADGAVVIVKDEADRKKFAGAIESALKEVGSEDTSEVAIDSTIVGGFILKTKDKQIDRSYKRALINLYRNIITK